MPDVYARRVSSAGATLVAYGVPKEALGEDGARCAQARLVTAPKRASEEGAGVTPGKREASLGRPRARSGTESETSPKDETGPGTAEESHSKTHAEVERDTAVVTPKGAVVFPVTIRVEAQRFDLTAWLQPEGSACDAKASDSSNEAYREQRGFEDLLPCNPQGDSKCAKKELTEPKRLCYYIYGQVEVKGKNSSRWVSGKSSTRYVDFHGKK